MIIVTNGSRLEKFMKFFKIPFLCYDCDKRVNRKKFNWIGWDLGICDDCKENIKH